MDNDLNEIADQLDPQEGMQWEDPQCMTCVFNKSAFCQKYNAHRTQLPVDMFDCPSYEPRSTENVDASKVFGLDIK